MDSLCGRMSLAGMISESARQGDGLSPDWDASRFESLLAESFGG
jgi:hypothetical protein